MKKNEINEYIVVVDDEIATLKILTSYLTKLGYKVKGFERPREALSAVAEGDVYLIISDFKMDEMNGLDLCDEVRKNYPGMIFVICTGYSDKELAFASLGRGVNDIIEKPFNLEKISSSIGKLADGYIERKEREKSELAEIVDLFVEESNELMGDADQLVLRLEDEPIDVHIVDSLFRKVHSVKGGAAAIPAAKDLSKLVHEFESVLAKLKKGQVKCNSEVIDLFLESTDLVITLLDTIKTGKPMETKVRERLDSAVEKLKVVNSTGAAPVVAASVEATAQVNVNAAAQKAEVHEDDGLWVSSEKMDSFMALSGELIVLKNRFSMMCREVGVLSDLNKLEKRLGDFSYGLNKLTDQLQDQILSVRKVSLERTFSKLPRIVRQTAQEVNKKVKLNMEGLELGVDKSIAKSLGSSLVHMVRNSIDHGIESAEKRRDLGKPEEATVTVKAYESRGLITIHVIDDGRGIDREKVLAKAIQNGLITKEKAPELTEDEVYDLLFLPGFSTAEKITGVSGRGVGMDVVKSSVVQHGGRVKTKSELGKGCNFTLEIPAPKAVLVEHTVVASWQDFMFAVPLTGIARIVSCDQLTLTEMSSMRMCQHDGSTIALRNYRELLDNAQTVTDDTFRTKAAVIIRNKNKIVGLLVDRIEDQFEAVVRPFDNIVKSVPGFKGTTVLGNERIAYVVSPEDIVTLLAA